MNRPRLAIVSGAVTLTLCAISSSPQSSKTTPKTVARSLGLRYVPERFGAYLLATPRTVDELHTLRVSKPEQWRGIVEAKPAKADLEWWIGEESVRIGDWIYFGDPEILKRLQAEW